MTSAFTAVTEDLVPRDRLAFAVFVERMRADAIEDAEQLLALRAAWVTTERPDLPREPLGQ